MHNYVGHVIENKDLEKTCVTILVFGKETRVIMTSLVYVFFSILYNVLLNTLLVFLSDYEKDLTIRRNCLVGRNIYIR